MNVYVPASKIVVFVFPIFAQYFMSGGMKTFSESVAGGSKLSSEPKGPGAKLKFGPDSGLEYERCSHSEYFFQNNLWFKPLNFIKMLIISISIIKLQGQPLGIDIK